MSTPEAAPLVKTHKIRLRPTARQVRQFHRNFAYRRRAYNFAVAFGRERAAEEKKKPKEKRRYPHKNEIEKEWNKQKKTICVDKETGEEWWREPHQLAAKQAITHDYPAAIAHWKHSGWNKKHKPNFHKFGQHDSYCAIYRHKKIEAVVDGKRIKLPKIDGWVRMREVLRLTGIIVQVTISRTADHYYASVTVQTTEYPTPPNGGPAAGVDLGLRQTAKVVSGHNPGTVQVYPQHLPNAGRLESRKRRLKKLQQLRSRTKKGSNRWLKLLEKERRTHERITFAEQDAIHKATVVIAKQHGRVGAENLHVKGMLKNKKLARHIAPQRWGEWRRQLGYKAPWYGSELVLVDQWYPSSQICSACGMKRGKGGVGPKLKLSEHTFVCYVCGFMCDRDENAARNLQRKAEQTVGFGEKKTKNRRRTG